MTIFYFTATGNSLYVAKQFNSRLLSIPQVLKTSVRSFCDDTIGIVTPCFYFGIPLPVEKFILTTELNSRYIFAIITYGSIAGAALRVLEKKAKKNGIRFSYLNQIKMLDNYIPMHDMKNEKAIIGKKNVAQNIKQIVADINAFNIKRAKNNIMKGFLSALEQKRYKARLKDVTRRFSIDGSCTRCGICVKVCPLDNIELKPHPLYHNNCIECCACIHHCPETAIHARGEKNNERFICAGIDKEEIITANR